MTSLYLTFIFLISLAASFFPGPSPFQLTFNYNDQQIINTNFTITTELHYDRLLTINCRNNRRRLCLVDLSLQIQFDRMSIKFWCQPPAFASFNQSYRCILQAVDAIQQPSITMIINSRDVGRLIPSATANFTYASPYNMKSQIETPIIIVRIKN